MKAKIKAEWDTLKRVVIHRPGIEMFFGLLDPEGSLYERAFSRKGAIREHQLLEDVLKNECGVEVILLKDAILQAANENLEVKKRLIDKARNVLKHIGDEENIKVTREQFDQQAKYLDPEHFFDILVMDPGLEVSVTGGIKSTKINNPELPPEFLEKLIMNENTFFITSYLFKHPIKFFKKYGMFILNNPKEITKVFGRVT